MSKQTSATTGYARSLCLTALEEVHVQLLPSPPVFGRLISVARWRRGAAALQLRVGGVEIDTPAHGSVRVLAREVKTPQRARENPD